MDPTPTVTADCVVDTKLLNEDTLADVVDMMGAIFGPACGLNRGSFVVDPPDGNTYGCTEFPQVFADAAGIDSAIPIVDANSVMEQFQGGNITAVQAMSVIDTFARTVYRSTPNVALDPFACNLNGLATLDCVSSNSGSNRPSVLSIDGTPIRSATLAGLFVPALWATGGKKLSIEDAVGKYKPSDFADMAELGLNTVLIPLPVSAFSNDKASVRKGLSTVLEMVQDSGLKAILALSSPDSDSDAENEAIRQAAIYAKTNSGVILALQLPSSMDTSMLEAARSVSKSLPILLPINLGQLQTLQVPDDHTFASLNLDHTNTVADIASSTSVNDRMKLFYHEATSCISRSPIEYASCYRQVPVFVSAGFDLAIDDCVHKDSISWKDYGQCDRFDETVGSPWWERHRRSFVARQLFAFEKGLGWNFAAYKLLGDDDMEGTITKPEQLLALKSVAAAGLLPSLHKSHPASMACLNPPEADFLLGDDTLAPSPGPAPDCGDGWWNYTISDCTYWVPPATEPPAPCPVCDSNNAFANPVAITAVCGLAIGVMIGALGFKTLNRRREGYAAIPN